MSKSDFSIPPGWEHDTISISSGNSADTINIDDLSFDMSTINIPSYTFSTPTSITTGATGSAGTYYTINTTAGMSGTSWANVGAVGSSGSTGLYVQTDATFEGDVKIQGKSISKTLEKIEERLAILTNPDMAKIEKFAALKKAYENYKMIERLIGDDPGPTEST